MATGSPSVQCGSPPKALPEIPQASADYYYLKAMEYLGVNSDSGQEEEASSCNCGHRCRHVDNGEKEEDDQFGFRPGLALDDDGSPEGSGNSSGPSTQCNSPSSTDPSAVGRRRAVSLGGPWEGPPAAGGGGIAAASTRQRKLSIGSLAYGRVTDSKVKRKLSDGHVHWADEFQKDLTRSHPRKTYNRHPSHSTAGVKPILKPQTEHDADCLDEEDDNCDDS